MSRSSQDTSETNPPYHSYRELGGDWPWPTGSRLPERLAIAREICLHDGIPPIEALKQALYNGESNYSSNEKKRLEEVIGAVNEAAYDTEYNENSQVDEIVPSSEEDGLVHRVSLGQRGETQGYVDDIVYPTEELKRRIARLDFGMHLSEQPDYLESEFSESHIEEYWKGEALEIDRDAVLEYYRGELECRALVRKEKSWDSDWWAEDNVRHHLEHRSFIPPGEADYLRHTMADQLRIDIEGRRKESGEGRYLENKFSDRSKAKEPYRRIKHAFEMAAEKGYRRGTRVSLSTYNKWHDSFEDEISNLNASLSGVFDNLRRDDLLGSTPDRVGVIEFTNSGLPHAHVVFFGVSPKQFPKAWLQDYWENTREQGKEIEVNEVGYSESRDQWLFGDGETPVSEYYTQTAKMMLDVAEGGDPRELTRQGDDHWKLAMHWASDEISQHERISESLIGDDIDESTVLDVTPRWISSGRDSFRDVRVGRDESSLNGKCGSTGCSEPLVKSGPWYQGLPPPC